MTARKKVTNRLLRVAGRTTNRLLNPLNLNLARRRKSNSVDQIRDLASQTPNLTLIESEDLFVLHSDTLVSGLIWMMRLSQRYAVRIWSKNQLLYASLGEITLKINTWEEMLIAFEVFGQSEYHYAGPNRVVVLDFGMNVGLASLYFASSPRVVRVFSYEPFKNTFALAEHNFALNQSLECKVERNNYAVGDEVATRSCGYDPARKGCCGSDAQLELIEDIDMKSVNLQEIQIRPASDEVLRVRKLYPETDLIIKMDIEGGENAVLKNLAGTGALREITAILMEWHYRWPDKLIDLLTSEGFSLHLQSQQTDINGKIYAFRTALVSD